MKEENKRCWSCGRFQRYYTKGYCSYHNKIVQKDESCKMWYFGQRVRNMRKKMAIDSIVDIRCKLEVIEQILTEEREPEKAKNEK